MNGCFDNPCGCLETDATCTGVNSVCYDVAAENDTVSPGGAYTCGPCNSGYQKRSGNDNSYCVSKLSTIVLK